MAEPVTEAAPPAAALTVGETLHSAVSRYGTRPWMAYAGRTRTFADLGQDVDAIARGLIAEGVSPGDRVGLYLGNCFEWLEIEYAVTGLGAWLVPVNTWFRRRELEHVLGQSKVSTLVWGGTLLGRDAITLLRQLVPELDDAEPGDWRSARFPHLQTIIGLGAGEWPRGVIAFDELLARGGAVTSGDVGDRRARVSPDDVALVMYTSGTTGAPKGAMIRHRGLVGHIGTWTRHLRLHADDRSIMASPLFWTFGCAINGLVPLFAGSMIVLEDRFEAGTFLRDLGEHRCTHLQGVPSQYEMALKHPESSAYDLSAIRLVQIGGSSSAEGLVERLLERAPRAQFLSAYGLTEGTAVNTWTELGDDLEAVMRTVGHAADDNEVALRDPDTGETVGPGEVGEIWISGDCVMAGYLDDPKATRQAIVDGWLRTGDLARADDRGYLTIVGREVDAYKRGGMNVYPAEVEAYLAEHPKIQLAAIVGTADPELGQVGLAFVVPVAGQQLTPDEVVSWCRDAIAGYKIPAEVRIVDELPMTPSGKVRKFELEEMLRTMSPQGG